jgi:subtilisin
VKQLLLDNRQLRRALTATVAVSGLLGMVALSPTLPSAEAQGIAPSFVPGQYIVVLNNEVVNPRAVASDMARKHGLGLRHVYGAALKGFAANIPAGRLHAIANDPRVKYVEPDQTVTADPSGQSGTPRLTATQGSWATFSIASAKPKPGTAAQPPQVLPNGIRCVGGNLSSTLSGNGSGSVNIDVAVLSSGIDTTHPDLNVVGGANFTKGSGYDDQYGNGTHEAGIIGALDNGIGVVGVAPGARLWAVKVLDSTGGGTEANVLAGIDWLVQKGTIKVALLGFAGGTNQPVNDAVAAAVNQGITIVTCAGNFSMDAHTVTPACVPGAITVAAMDDSNNTFAGFSNYCNDANLVDMIAPGVNVYSTWYGGGYSTQSNTFASAAHVAGAVALYLSNHPGASPAGVRSALVTAPGVVQIAGIHGETRTYPLVNVSSF